MRTISSILDNYNTAKNIDLSELRSSKNGGEIHSDDGKLKCWYFGLPDAATAANHLSTSAADITLPGDEAKRVKIWPRKTIDALWKDSEAIPALVCLDEQTFFIPVLFPLNQGEALVIWARISSTNTALLFDDSKTENLAGISCWAVVANLIQHQSSRAGLFSFVKILKKKNYPFPIVSSVDDSYTQYTGLEKIFSTRDSINKEEQVSLDSIIQANSQRFSEGLLNFEEKVFDENYDEAEKLVEQFSSSWSSDSRAQFSLGIYFSRRNQHSKAASAFHDAQLLGHPDALEQEWAALSRQSKPFREEYKEAFDEIKRGEGLRALTTLRYAAQNNPVSGNAILAYCLRSANEPEEGLKACTTTLELAPNQSDVIGHKWSYLTALMRDEEALETAIDHLTRYPLDLSAVVNLKDSLRILGKADQAKLLCERYDIFTPHTETSLKHYFDVYEQIGKWETLREIFDRRLQFIRSPMVETRQKYAEALVETESFDQAMQVFEEALAIEPGNSSVVLGYSRCLARVGKEEEAESLLTTVLQDETRIDGLAGKSFIVCTLAEIQRRTGRPELAIELIKEKLPGDLLELSDIVGPVPALEYAENLIALEKAVEAKDFIGKLYSRWPDDEYVKEIKTFIEENA